MANNDDLAKALREHRERHTVQVTSIASSPLHKGTVVQGTLQGAIVFTVPVADSSVSHSSGSIS